VSGCQALSADLLVVEAEPALLSVLDLLSDDAAGLDSAPASPFDVPSFDADSFEADSLAFFRASDG
jgi:hypothetical protein